MVFVVAIGEVSEGAVKYKTTVSARSRRKAGGKLFRRDEQPNIGEACLFMRHSCALPLLAGAISEKAERQAVGKLSLFFTHQCSCQDSKARIEPETTSLAASLLWSIGRAILHPSTCKFEGQHELAGS